MSSSNDLVTSAEQFVEKIERSLSLESLIDQAWEAIESRGDARFTAPIGLCSMSLDHGRALRKLVGQVPPSAVALLRAQYEALVRAVWARHAATDRDLNWLLAPLTKESQQAAKKLPGIPEMLEGIKKSGPMGAEPSLARARARLIDGMNSYIHCGIHPFQRGQGGYPISLLVDVLKNSNAMSMLTLIVLAELTNDADVVGFLSEMNAEFEDVLPEIEPLGLP